MDKDSQMCYIEFKAKYLHLTVGKEAVLKTQSNINKTTAIYCRTAHRDDLAIQRQKNDIIAFSSEQGYENITFYVDNGFSGVIFDRPDFKRLEADINK